MSTTVPTTWQINVSLTLQGGSFRVVRMPASITLNFAEIPRERPEDSGHLAREWRRARRNTESERSRLMLATIDSHTGVRIDGSNADLAVQPFVGLCAQRDAGCAASRRPHIAASGQDISAKLLF